MNMPVSPRRIAILRALQLGDLLVAVPAFRAIRNRFPGAEITLIGLPWAASFVQRYRHYLDRFVAFVGYPGLQEQPFDEQNTAHFLAEQRAYNYDLVIQMHGSGQSSNPLALELGGKVTVGYYEDTPPSGLVGAPYPHDKHEIWRNLGIAALLDCTQLDPHLEFPLFEEDYAEATMLLRTLSHARKPWVGLHPGSRPPARRWPADYFADVANNLAQRFDAQIILTGGPDEEQTAQAVLKHIKMPTLNLAGKTSLGGLAAVISKLDLFISNDTGPSHIACAVDTPSITIFGPADCQRWAPLDTIHHPFVRRPVACSPCGYWECPIDHRCLRWLNPEMVLPIAQNFLRHFMEEITCETSKNLDLAHSRQLSQYPGPHRP
jgi:ADP-heptose:LPS heptosyltransferase